MRKLSHSSSIVSNSRMRLMKLEPRMLFDGAALAEVLSVDSWADDTHSSHETAAQADTLPPLGERSIVWELFSIQGSTLPVVTTATDQATGAIRDYLANSSDETLFEMFSGGADMASAQWSERLALLRQGVADGTLQVNVVQVDGSVLGSAVAAFTPAGPEQQATILVNQAWFSMFDAPDATRILVEEYGHAIDHFLNGQRDTPGDEGEAFSLRVLDLPANSSSSLENDHRTIEWNSESYSVETATFNFANAYQMVYDLDNDSSADGSGNITGGIDNDERWGEKEQNLHYFNASSTTAVAGTGLGPAVINDNNYDSANFSGNDVSAIGINIDGTDYYGWISRPIKSGGVVKGFYFWTDTQFNINSSPEVNLATAQADGNRDTDGSVLDNQGFILVVDQDWFDALILSSGVAYDGTTDPLINNAKDGNLGSIIVASVGSSSDRVDSALNALLASLPPPQPLVATPDVADGMPGTSGGAALEEGGDDNTASLNTLTPGGNLTDTINATGNVLDNDINTSGLKPPAVIGIFSNTTNESSTITSTTAGVVTGRYGMLTQNADGSYTYVIDNTDSVVQALLPSSTPLQDVFTYTVNDGLGGTTSTTLTIQIRGSNDAPVAANDYNTAKVITTTSNTGYAATGTVLTNDSDSDTGDGKTIFGASVSGQITSSTVVSTPGNASIQFTTSNGFNSVTDGTGPTADEVYVHIGIKTAANGDVYTGLYTYDAVTGAYTLVFVTAKTASSGSTPGSVTFNATPTHFWDATASVFKSIVDASINQTLANFFTANPNLIFKNTTDITPTIGETYTQTNADKTATTTAVSSTGYTTISGLSSQSGTIAIGMTVTGAGVPSGTKVSDITLTSGVITSIKLDSEYVTSLNGTSFIFTGGSGSGVTLAGAHGAITIDLNGVYTYTPTTDNIKLLAGDSAVESFDYIMQDALGAKSQATLYITVYGSGTNDPVGENDSIIATEAGGSTNGTAGVDPAASVSPNRLIDNDATDATNFPNKYVTAVTSTETGSSSNPVANSVAVTIGTNPAVVAGKYGTLTVGADGSYLYAVDNSNTAVEALRTIDQTLTETFTYVVKNYSSTNVLGGADSALITVTIRGTNDTPVARNDPATATAGQFPATGNVLNNDLDVDAGDGKIVTHAQAGSTATPGTTVTSATSISGTYGTLILNPDGTYTYTIDENNATVKALAAGTTGLETFSYQMRDTAGATSIAELRVTVTGRNDAPVNSNPVAVTGTLDTSINFDGAKTISVADFDGDLTSVALHVDYGTLVSSTNTASFTGFAITGSGTGDLVISGNQADINAYLADLSYTPTTGFTGTDFLTLFSQDSNNAYDSDGFAISIPTSFTGPTVKESDLPSGTNASGTEDRGTTTLAAPSGQSFGTSDQSDTDTYGTWTLTTGGLFTYTLITAPATTGNSTAHTVNIVTYDQFGNATSNPVAVTIMDDTPTATPDTKSVNEGDTATGNVLTDGIPDTFGADGATTSPVGGVIGFKTGSDTFTPATSNIGTEVTGAYGKLTLNADGSYSYVANSNAVTSAQNDVFVYTIEDAGGSRSSATLTIRVEDVAPVNTAPVNTVPALQTINEDTALVFTSATGNLISVNDVNGNLASTQLTVTNGKLTVDLSGGATISAGTSNSASLTLSGTQIQINAALATLSYQGNLNFNGSDTLTVISTDSAGIPLNDTDTVSIAVTSVADPLTVSSPSVNEASPYVVFTVNGVAGEQVSLALTAGTATGGGTDFGAPGVTNLQVSIDGGANWTNYSSAITTPAGGSFLVRTPIIEDSPSDNGEQFTLTATPVGGTAAVGTATINDDGTGTIFSGNGGEDNAALKTDDRPVTVTSPTVNEASPYAVFTVTGTAGQNVALLLTAGTATGGGTDFGAPGVTNLQVSIDGGANWTNYSSAITTPSGGSFLVRTPIIEDSTSDNGEQFTLTATPVGGTAAVGTATINDDGTGTVFNANGTPNADALKTDDRPVFSISNVTVSEGGLATFTVTRSGTSAVSQTVDVSTLGLALPDTAESDDFTAVTATTLNFATGESSKTFTVQTTQDTIFEGAETFRVQLANATGGSLISGTNATAIGTIVDDGRDLDGIRANDDRPVSTIAPPPAPIVTVSESAAPVAPPTTEPSLHVLLAVQEAQEQASDGGGLVAPQDGFRSVGAGLTTAPSLYVLPAVQDASGSNRSASRAALQQFELSENEARQSEAADAESTSLAEFTLFETSQPANDAPTPAAANAAQTSAPASAGPVAPQTNAPQNNAPADAGDIDLEEAEPAQEPLVLQPVQQIGRVDAGQQLQALARSYRTVDQAADLARMFAEAEAPEAETI